MKSALRLSLFAALMVALPALAHAHPGHEGHELTWGFNTGFAHPFSGWDHLLAMISVGLWASLLGGRARWLVPAAFMGAMVLGAAASRSGLALPAIEPGIAASLFILGLLVAFAVRLPLLISALVVGVFALFHGFAHGAEMPAAANGAWYGFGFLISTGLLHWTGVGLGMISSHHSTLRRTAGGAIAVIGAFALLG